MSWAYIHRCLTCNQLRKHCTHRNPSITPGLINLHISQNVYTNWNQKGPDPACLKFVGQNRLVIQNVPHKTGPTSCFARLILVLYKTLHSVLNSMLPLHNSVNNNFPESLSYRDLLICIFLFRRKPSEGIWKRKVICLILFRFVKSSILPVS